MQKTQFGNIEQTSLARWKLTVVLAPGAPVPLFVQVAQAIVQDIRRGRLRPLDRLPGSRALALDLQVHRNTVLAAYQELAKEGWIQTHPARGTFISEALPQVAPAPFAPVVPARAQLGYPLPPAPPTHWLARAYPPGTLVLAGGVPDVRLVPVAELAREYRRALKNSHGAWLNYGEVGGHPRLRAALAQMLAEARGLVVTADNLIITRGSQMGLYLVARVLLAPGDTVLVEDPGYRPAWGAFQRAGAHLVGVPVDNEGVQMTPELLKKIRPRAIYLTPHHQYPTTVTLSPARRLNLLAAAAEVGCAVIEDDYDHEVHFDGRPILPLASADPGGNVIYIGTLSKVLAPGLRIGFVAGPPALIQSLEALRSVIDVHGDPAAELAVAFLLEDGVVQRHVRKMQKVYRTRRDLLAELLQKKLGERLSFVLPSGGMALWAQVIGLCEARWAQAALARGVAVYPGKNFSLEERPLPYFRLGFASRNPVELNLAVERLAAAVADLS